ncbi:hypothetical protein BX600DRAFT_56095 [Xylariales sp. PMI_506]|nr:hypothetical protein BX600DRAFT_56095 [Xylariales sp. PMI_506]
MWIRLGGVPLRWCPWVGKAGGIPQRLILRLDSPARWIDGIKTRRHRRQHRKLLLLKTTGAVSRHEEPEAWHHCWVVRGGLPLYREFLGEFRGRQGLPPRVAHVRRQTAAALSSSVGEYCKPSKCRTFVEAWTFPGGAVLDPPKLLLDSVSLNLQLIWGWFVLLVATSMLSIYCPQQGNLAQSDILYE